MTPLASHSVRQWRDGEFSEKFDDLAVEEPLEIRIDGRRYTATMRTPGATPRDDLLLAQGLLFSEGVISSADDLEGLQFSTRCRAGESELVNVVNATLHDSSNVRPELWERSLISNSSCGLCGKSSVEAFSAKFEPLPKFEAPKLAILRTLPEILRQNQPIFTQTGGLHAAAIFRQNGDLLAVFEDIGRHNATDKALGLGLEEGWIPAREPLILLVSGRASFEIVQKTLVARISTLAAVSAASSLAVDFAAANGLNLVGFLRPRGLTVYCGEIES